VRLRPYLPHPLSLQLNESGVVIRFDKEYTMILRVPHQKKIKSSF
jgi:hypothetical protein